jgi:hypothetical protein
MTYEHKKYVLGVDVASSRTTDSTVITVAWVRDDGIMEILRSPSAESINSIIFTAFGVPKKYWGKDDGKDTH